MLRPLLIVWQEHNDTGITLIDEQHRGIVSIINTFYYLVSIGMGNTNLYSRTIITTREYSKIHFATEEYLLSACEYDGIENHKELHKNFIFDIEKIRQNVLNTNDPMPLFKFLKNWWVTHINEEDKAYVPYILTSRNSDCM